MSIKYRVNASITVDQFIDLLKKSGLAERRPVRDRQCIQGMIDNSNLTATAWNGAQLVGIARAMTDFHYACYLSDLAVDAEFQGVGIGTTLQVLVQQQLGENCKLLLLAAPTANEYYAKLGFESHEHCWTLPRHKRLLSPKVPVSS
ncbi:GNAT family N-acetyltransferase [Echinimonas agarilytica]|uniref:GNAT family N-acetyltransferase n=1 Tax=Echinimonas agarilytica TaxID=1215918 RepID=A0AA41W8J3_9GAMM|nr:GNAT family N-acetyltransferase [Echinimonas agarilytica]MCM2680989.1 GNAT family N-acetyltransferase [Echinimonas agarilytica]